MLKALLTLPLMLLTADGETVSVETIMSILKAVTDVMSIQTIVAFIAGLIAVCMSFVFLWWGVRKGFKMIMRAVTKGKISV